MALEEPVPSPDAPFKFDDKTILDCTASALLTKCKFSQCPAFAKHAEANVNRLVAAIRQARPTEQHPIIMIRRMAQRNPSQTARNFEATALSGQP
jgi:hypothetical protein